MGSDEMGCYVMLRDVMEYYGMGLDGIEQDRIE